MLAGHVDLDELDRWMRIGGNVAAGRQCRTRTAKTSPRFATKRGWLAASGGPSKRPQLHYPRHVRRGEARNVCGLSMILAQAPSAPRFCTRSATARSPPSVAQLSMMRALRSGLITVQPLPASLRPAARRAASPTRQRDHLGPARPDRSDRRWSRQGAGCVKSRRF
jgi:hypothetical protein